MFGWEWPEAILAPVFGEMFVLFTEPDRLNQLGLLHINRPLHGDDQACLVEQVDLGRGKMGDLTV